MSSNTEHARGLILINGHAYPVNEVLNALERQAMTTIRVVGNDLWIGNDRIHPFSKTTPEQAMKLTCFGSLAFCCDLNRSCNLRDEALQLIGMTREEYQEIQHECHQHFLRMGERRWPQDIGIHSREESSTSQFGSYKRDYSRPEPRDQWHKSRPSSYPTKPYGTTSGSSGSSTRNVDLGNLFDQVHEEQTSRYSSFRESPLGGATRQVQPSFSPTSNGWTQSEGFTMSAISPSKTTPQGFCIYCGQDLQKESEFCIRCGRSQS